MLLHGYVMKGQNLPLILIRSTIVTSAKLKKEIQAIVQTMNTLLQSDRSSPEEITQLESDKQVMADLLEKTLNDAK